MKSINEIFSLAYSQGRNVLFEHEVYKILSMSGIKAPGHVYIPSGTDLNPDILGKFGSKVVLKIASQSVLHKTDAGGVRIIKNDPVLVQKERNHMLCDAKNADGVLICEFIEHEASGFGNELMTGIRWTEEFGHVFVFGAGGVDGEFFIRNFRENEASIIGSAELLSDSEIAEELSGTAIFQKITGRTRSREISLDGNLIVKTIRTFLRIGKEFSDMNPASQFCIEEMEVNPFAAKNGELIALDGLLRFRQARKISDCAPLGKVEKILKPQNIGIAGVSKKMNMGHIILDNIIRSGFEKEKIFIVKSGIDQIDGVKCFPEIKQLPDRVDVFIVVIDASGVPELVREIIEYDRAESVILIPSGMAEKKGGEEIERKIREAFMEKRAKGLDTPVFNGGNCLGILSKPGKYDTFFVVPHKLPRIEKGISNFAIMGQSGAYIITKMSKSPVLSPYYAISTGNQIDLTVSHYMNYLAQERNVDVIGVYVEGFREMDGLCFANAVRKAVISGKDVIVYKAGRTEQGKTASAGHTAAVSGDYLVCRKILNRCGALIVSDFEEFYDMLNLCCMLRVKKIQGTRTGALSNAGYETVGIADNIRGENYRLELLEFTEQTKKKIKEIISAKSLEGLFDIRNPLDLTPMADDQANEQIFRTILADRNVDCAIYSTVPFTTKMNTLPEGKAHSENISDPSGIVQGLIRLFNESSKPFICSVDAGSLYDPMALELEKNGIPVFRSVDRAVKVFGKYVCHKLKKTCLIHDGTMRTLCTMKKNDQKF